MQAIPSPNPQTAFHQFGGDNHTEKHAYIVYDPKAEYYSCRIQQVMWKTAEILALLAQGVIPFVTAALIGGAIGVACGFAAFALAYTALNPVQKHAKEKGETAAEEVKIASAILEKMNSIEDNEIRGRLLSLGVDTLLLPEEEYKPLLARHAYVSERREQFQKKIKEQDKAIEENLAKAGNQSTPEERKAFEEACDARALLAYTKATCARNLLEETYLLYVMHCPTSAKPRSDFFEIFQREPMHTVMGSLHESFYAPFIKLNNDQLWGINDILYEPDSDLAVFERALNLLMPLFEIDISDGGSSSDASTGDSD